MIESGTVSMLRVANRSRILRLIAERRSISRTELASETGLKPPSVTRIVKELIDLGLVSDEPGRQARAQPGRRRTGLRVRADGAHVLGFALNASGMAVGLSDASGMLIAQQRIEGSKRLDAEQTLSALAAAANTLIEQHVPNRTRILGAGVACAGEVDTASGLLRTSMAMGWTNVKIGQILTGALGIPIRIDNLNVSLLKAARLKWFDTTDRLDVENALLVRVANGILGSAFLSNGTVLRNTQSRHSWIGHHPVRGGVLPCSCGETGCLNTVASAPAILAAYDDSDTPASFTASDFIHNERRLRRLVKAAQDGDAKARQVISDAGRTLGRFLVAQACSFGAEVIQIAGFVGCSPAYLSGVREGFGAWAPAGAARGVRIAANSMSLVESAVHVALDQFVYSRTLDIDRLTGSRSKSRTAGHDADAA